MDYLCTPTVAPLMHIYIYILTIAFSSGFQAFLVRFLFCVPALGFPRLLFHAFPRPAPPTPVFPLSIAAISLEGATWNLQRTPTALASPSFSVQRSFGASCLYYILADPHGYLTSAVRLYEQHVHNSTHTYEKRYVRAEFSDTNRDGTRDRSLDFHFVFLFLSSDAARSYLPNYCFQKTFTCVPYYCCTNVLMDTVRGFWLCSSWTWE